MALTIKGVVLFYKLWMYFNIGKMEKMEVFESITDYTYYYWHDKSQFDALAVGMCYILWVLNDMSMFRVLPFKDETVSGQVE